MAWYYILASMSNVLQYQHQAMPTAYDMMTSLKEMFGDQNRATRLVTPRISDPRVFGDIGFGDGYLKSLAKKEALKRHIFFLKIRHDPFVYKNFGLILENLIEKHVQQEYLINKIHPFIFKVQIKN